jgi:hypothetical protein
MSFTVFYVLYIICLQVHGFSRQDTRTFMEYGIHIHNWEISVCCRGAVKDFSYVSCDIVSLGDQSVMFWKSLVAFLLYRLIPKMKALQSFKTSATTCPVALCHISEDWNLWVNGCGDVTITKYCFDIVCCVFRSETIMQSECFAVILKNILLYLMPYILCQGIFLLSFMKKLS